nr:MAG TPA: hypothetical protein [Caudoviricetes sp.]
MNCLSVLNITRQCSRDYLQGHTCQCNHANLIEIY